VSPRHFYFVLTFMTATPKQPHPHTLQVSFALLLVVVSLPRH
jgi:hypothetical protein